MNNSSYRRTPIIKGKENKTGNNGECSKENSKENKTIRNPLGYLCYNVALPNEKQKVNDVGTKPKILKIRSFSVSDLIDKKKLSKITIRDSDNNNKCATTSNEVFVRGDQHPINFATSLISLKKKKNSSDVQHEELLQNTLPSVPVARNSLGTVVPDKIQKPAQKTTLIKKLRGRHLRLSCSTDYWNNLYNIDYFLDNFEYMLDMEDQFVYRKSFLQKHLNNYRAIVINWLVYIQQVLELNECSTFIGVRLFDKFVIEKKSKHDNYIIIAITCLWIAAKFIDSGIINVSKLYSLCRGRYSRVEFRTLEQDILNTLNFKINFPEPVSYLYYCIQNIKLENNMIVYYGSLFHLEIFMLLLDYSATLPSLLATISIYRTLKKTDTNLRELLEYINLNLPISMENFLETYSLYNKKFKEIIKHDRICNEVITKYSSQKTYFVAKLFI